MILEANKRIFLSWIVDNIGNKLNFFQYNFHVCLVHKFDALYIQIFCNNFRKFILLLVLSDGDNVGGGA